MSKKKLDTSVIANELRGESVFFPKVREKQAEPKQQLASSHLTESNTKTNPSSDTVVSRYHDTVLSRV